MSYLDSTGLAYFYSKLKEKFIRSVNSQTPDASGNVSITNVATADNLTSPDAQASYGTFIYRTSGGNASLSSGEAQLVYVDGNIEIEGRVVENFDITTDNGISVSCSASIWRSQISSDGTYVFTYTKPTSSAASMSWTAQGTWTFNSAQVSMASYGLYPSNVIDPSVSIAVSGSGVSAATIVPSTFFGQVPSGGTMVFMYSSEDGWITSESGVVTLSTYGIAVSGTPADGDALTVTSIAGTPNSTVTIVYTAPAQGTIVPATPVTFSATGFNQFDKNSMVVNNVSFSGGKIIQNSGTYACYCRAKSGVDNGYVAYSEADAIIDIGWCATIPTVGADIVTTGQSVSASLASIPFNEDGYVVVIVSATTDICIHPKWSGAADTEYAAYVAPSTITIPTTDTDGNDLPTATYGMPRIGIVADRLNLDAGIYVQRIGRLQNTSSNMNYVTSLDVAYDYDDEYIYYVLPNAITYNINIDPIYTVNDWGTEEFTGTSVALSAQMLYGQNLRDKLRTDVVTISAQELTQNQKNQICTNIGAVNKAGDTMTGELRINDNNFVIKNNVADITAASISAQQNNWYRVYDKNGRTLVNFDGIQETDGTSKARIFARNQGTGTSIDNSLTLGVAHDGTRTVSVTQPSAWRDAIGAVNIAGDVMTGNLTIEQAAPGIYAKATDVTDGVAPSADTNQIGFRVVDKNGVNIAIFTDRELTDGRQGAWIAGSRNGITNNLYLYVDSNGNRSVGLSDSAPWRSSLGLCYKTNDTMAIPSSAVLSGVVRSTSQIYFDFTVEKSMENISTITVTAMTGDLQGINGRIESTNTDFVSSSAYTITCVKQGDRHIRILLAKSSAMSSATAYTPACYFGTITLKFT